MHAHIYDIKVYKIYKNINKLIVNTFLHIIGLCSDCSRLLGRNPNADGHHKINLKCTKPDPTLIHHVQWACCSRNLNGFL